MQADTSMKSSYIARKPGKGLKRAYMRAKPKQGRKAAIAEADRALQEAVLARDKYMCQYPGCMSHHDTEGHHIIHRRNRVLRWALKNVVSLCRECHSLEGTAQRWRLDEFLLQWLGGQEAYEALRLEGNTGTSEEPGDAIRRMSENTDSM